MTNVTDLKLEKDILPLFDHTHNSFAQDELKHLFLRPLSSVEDIIERQLILKGFIAHMPVIRDFSYSSTDFREIYDFIVFTNNSEKNYNREGLSLQLWVSPSKRQRLESRIIQTVMLFHRIKTVYLDQIDVLQFPEQYQQHILLMRDYLLRYDTTRYESVVRNRRLKVSQLATLYNHIRLEISNGNSLQFLKSFFLFEAYLSAGIACAKLRFSFPSFHTEGLAISNFYHPLISNPVMNSLVSTTHLLLLTGPNMSGKSTLLKSIGICVYLAHIGFPVPASACSIPFFDTISVSLHHKDNLQKGYSHFLSDVVALKNILLCLREKKSCFAIFDELFNGTTMEDALHILKKTISGLSASENSFFCLATHLHQLKELAVVQNAQVDTFHLDCTITNGRPDFTYTLKKGWSDLKIGRLLFENEGLNDLLDSSPGEYDK